MLWGPSHHGGRQLELHVEEAALADVLGHADLRRRRPTVSKAAAAGAAMCAAKEIMQPLTDRAACRLFCCGRVRCKSRCDSRANATKEMMQPCLLLPACHLSGCGAALPRSR